MPADVEDNSWEEVYRANGVRCDIETSVSSPCEAGVCPTPPANPFPFFSIDRSRPVLASVAPLEAFA